MLNDEAPDQGVLARMLALKQQHPLPEGDTLPDSITLGLDREQQCAKPGEFDTFAANNPLWGMPYGLPGLNKQEHATLTNWLMQGAHGVPLASPTNAQIDAVQRWETFFNGKSLKDFDIAPFVMVAPNDDLDAAFDSLRPWLALYIGGMGAKGKNFYHEYATRLGYGEVATRIQDLYLAGKKEEATALVPNQLLDEVGLIGSHGRIVERLAPWKEAGKRGEVGSMLLNIANPAILELFARELL